MKTIFLIITILVSLCQIKSFGQEAKIMLLHANNVTMFDKTQLSNAIKASQDGDTILLTAGEFKGNVTIDKKISIVGAGQNSVITENVSLSFNGEQTFSARVLDGVKITGDLFIYSPLNDLSVRKVKMRNLEVKSSGRCKNAIFDRCNFDLIYGEDAVNGTVINSYVHQTFTASRNLCFVNCFIYQINGQSNYSNNFAAACTNSIIRQQQYSTGIADSSILRNCIIGSGIQCEGSLKENCQILSFSEIDQLDRTNTSELVKSGFVGMDGNAIGEYGGLTPYSLEPSGPKITSIEIKVDPTSNKLKVSATGKVN